MWSNEPPVTPPRSVMANFCPFRAALKPQAAQFAVKTSLWEQFASKRCHYSNDSVVVVEPFMPGCREVNASGVMEEVPAVSYH